MRQYFIEMVLYIDKIDVRYDIIAMRSLII